VIFGSGCSLKLIWCVRAAAGALVAAAAAGAGEGLIIRCCSIAKGNNF